MSASVPAATSPASVAPLGLAVPLAFTALLASLTALPAIRASAGASRSILEAAGLLGGWAVGLGLFSAWRGRSLSLRLEPRKQHYIQACAQGSVILYWGFYWRQEYASAPFILAQVLFAYAFDALLSWSRRDAYVLGMGPLPVIFSINLFLLFKPEWFHLQLWMVAVGFAAKELIRWDKGGRRAHVFNPSSFPLALFSLGLIVTKSTGITWGRQIATTLNLAPGMFTFIFVTGLVGQYLFGVTTMTMSAAVSLYVFGLIHVAVTGVPYFSDELIPIAVFLGMHLLFTDPSTAPATELGRMIFGVLFSAGIVLTCVILQWLEAPTFYDKLLPVPLLNLTIRAIDRGVRSRRVAWLDPGNRATWLAPRRRHLAYMGVWALAFALMSAHGISAAGRKSALFPFLP